MLPTVRDQGERETCLSIAITDGHQAIRGDELILAPDYLHAHAARSLGVGVNDAVTVTAAIGVLAIEGQPEEATCPYSPSARPEDWWPATPQQTWRRISSEGSSGEAWAVLSAQLRLRRPVVVILGIDEVFCTGVGSVLSDAAGPVLGSHAVLAVALGREQVLIRNSWGAAWCESGLVWLSLEYFTARCTGIISFGEEPS